MLEEYDKIDAITKSDDGSMQLVIMDAGLTEDPDERYSHLLNKLRTYVAHATSSHFREEYPDVVLQKVSFLVMCRIPPTEKMENTTAIARGDNRAETFTINYRHFPGADEESEKRPLDKVLSPIVEKSGNVPVHIVFAFLFAFILATRYLLYFGPGANLHSISLAQAIGATLGYLFVWSLAYWFCATSPRKALVTWLGGLAVVLSTLVGSIAGYVLLIVIFLIRKNQIKKS